MAEGDWIRRYERRERSVWGAVEIALLALIVGIVLGNLWSAWHG